MKRLSNIENRQLTQNITDVILTIVNSGYWNDMDIQFEDFYDCNEELQVVMIYRFKNEPLWHMCKITDQTKFWIQDQIDEWEKWNNKSISPICIHYERQVISIITAVFIILFLIVCVFDILLMKGKSNEDDQER